MQKWLCVYCASSDTLDERYYHAAREMGTLIARNNYGLVYGGGKVGMMGACAIAVHEHHGKVIGVIPEYLADKEIAYEKCDELIITQTMRQRKAIMDERASAFIALPGGYGTLEELLEIITLRHLRFHEKPIIIVNTDGFYDDLLKVFDKLILERFAKPRHKQAYHVCSTPAEVFTHLNSYAIFDPGSKWF